MPHEARLRELGLFSLEETQRGYVGNIQLIKDCNENVQRMKSTEELIHLSQNMEFECKHIEQTPGPLSETESHEKEEAVNSTQKEAEQTASSPSDADLPEPETEDTIVKENEEFLDRVENLQHVNVVQKEEEQQQAKAAEENPERRENEKTCWNRIFPLISQSRRLVKSGELTALEYNMSLKWKLTTRPIYLHLFNDYLLLSRPRENGRFIVFDYAASSDVRGEKCEMKLHGANKNVFRLFLLQNNQGKKVEFLFRTETQSEKLRWISALMPPQTEPDLLGDPDAPQVQCVRSYKARENDELALEKADIIMVLWQTSDGWIEGVKLSDGERGWFPSEQVEFISSKHVRQMNLKEEQRVKNAKQHVFRRK
ncbi:Rho guanine nucleotide exchange factor 5 [Varanus komodoensis]|nr:Rho guanine nucleotide exchange factor 5 [Varanus komodoensis]